MPHPVPHGPWHVLAVDVFVLEQGKFVVLVNYCSKYFELAQLKDSTSASVINCLNSICQDMEYRKLSIQIMALNLAVWNFNSLPNSINFSM